jgi:LPXTG-motif cell wall-anchored protein
MSDQNFATAAGMKAAARIIGARMPQNRMRLVSERTARLPPAMRLRRMAAVSFLGAGLAGGLIVATAGPATAAPGIAAAYGTAAQIVTVSISNDTVTVMVHGMNPGETVKIYMASTPTLLGSVTANSAGVMNATFPLPAGLAAGTHTITVIGPGTDLSAVVTLAEGTAPAEAAAPATEPSVSSDPTQPSTQLPYTGADITGATALGAVLVAGGGILVLRSRRRRSPASG